MKQNVLKKAFEEKTLIGMRTNREEWDETIIGFITELDELSLTISEVDKYGFDIGQTQIEIDDIIHIDVDDPYQRRLSYIINNRFVFDRSKTKTLWRKGEALLSCIHPLIEEKKIVTLYLEEDEYITGIILEYERPYIMVRCIGRDGREDGVSYYPIDNLTGARYDGLEEQKIKLLYENDDY